MGKPLFDNVGGELKNLAEMVARRITLYYGLVGVIIAIIGVAVAVETEGWVAFVAIILAAAVAFYGYNKAHLQVITLYAYGELVERVSSVDQKLGKDNFSAKVRGVSVKQEHTTPLVEKERDGSWICPFCEHKNPSGVDWCEECGVEGVFK